MAEKNTRTAFKLPTLTNPEAVAAMAKAGGGGGVFYSRKTPSGKEHKAFCPFCPKSYLGGGSLLGHMKTMHSDKVGETPAPGISFEMTPPVVVPGTVEAPKSTFVLPAPVATPAPAVVAPEVPELPKAPIREFSMPDISGTLPTAPQPKIVPPPPPKQTMTVARNGKWY